MNTSNNEVQNRFWSYASVFGTVWGVFEITIGSFLHATRIPFVSVIVAIAGMSVLIVERRMINVFGISFVTGVIATMCKSISPGGIIIGPMIGIMAEALIFELIFSIFGSNLFSSVISSIFASGWIVFQGLFMQYVYLGSGAINVYLKIAKKAGGTGIVVFVSYLSVPIILGFSGGILSYMLSSRIKKELV